MDDTITISMSEYDRMRSEISTLLDLHALIRKTTPLVYGEEMSIHEKNELKMSYQHFHGQYVIRSEFLN